MTIQKINLLAHKTLGEILKLIENVTTDGKRDVIPFRNAAAEVRRRRATATADASLAAAAQLRTAR